MKLSDLYNPSNYNANYEKYEDQYIINEGLIRTWPIDRSLKILKNNKIQCEQVPDQNIFYIDFLYNSKISIETVLELINNVGWFPSYCYYLNNGIEIDRGKFDINEFKHYIGQRYNAKIRCEAKYDIMILDIPDKLYHVTGKINAPKILKIGLSPRTKSKTAKHPDRIYLGIKPDLLERMVMNHPTFWENNMEFVIFEIKTRLLPDYVRFYRDPNAKQFGIYTLNNIPSPAINIYKEFSI